MPYRPDTLPTEPTAGPSVPGSGYGLGDTIYSAIKKALGDMEGGGDSGGGGGDSSSSTQTLTVTKRDASDTVSVTTMSWADYIAMTMNPDTLVEVQPDSTEGLVSVYSIPVGAEFFTTINDDDATMYLDAEMTRIIITKAMPSTPLYASTEQAVLPVPPGGN